MENLTQLSDEELAAKYEEVLGKKPGNRTRETQIEELLAGTTENEDKVLGEKYAELQARLEALVAENAKLKESKEMPEVKTGKVLKKAKREPEILTEDQRIAIQKHEFAKKKREQLAGKKEKKIKASENEDFDVLESEAGHIHILITNNHYQAATNKMVREQRLEKIWPRVWPSLKRSIMTQNEEVELIHIPEGAEKLFEDKAE